MHPDVVPLFSTRWYPVEPAVDHVRRTEKARVRFRRGDFLYPEDLVQKKAQRLGIPFHCLTTATQLEHGGFRPEIIDLQLEVSPRVRIEQHRSDILCVGIECQLAYSYAEASSISRSLRKILPGVPIVWFGYASTIFAYHLCSEGTADIVVRGQPEVTFIETVRALSDGKPLKSIDGITFLDMSGGVIKNSDRPLVLGEETPPLSYHLLPTDSYSLANGHVVYRTSIGCSLGCSFCPYATMYGQSRATLPPGRVVEELSNLQKKYGLKSVDFSDQSFFEKKDRVMEICEGLIRAGLDIRWRASGEISLLYNYSDESIRLLERSGCNEIHFGVESASDRLMRGQNKPFDRDACIDTVRRLQEAGIRPVANFVFGFPGELDEDFDATWRLIRDLQEVQPELGTLYNYFTLLPGTKLYDKLRSEGKSGTYLPETDHLSAWVEFSKDMRYPWFVNRYARRIALYYHVVSFDTVRLKTHLKRSLLRYALPLYRRYARWRIKHRFYKLALDYHLARARYRLRTNRCWRYAYKMDLFE